MKKAFVKPSLKSYALNKKENIVASSTWNDGTMTTHWKFHQYTPGAPQTNENLITGEQGCFDMLDYTLATTTTRLTYEGAWNDWIAQLSRYTNPDDSEYNQQSALADWNAYKACRN